MTFAIQFFGAFALVMISTITAVKLANSIWLNNLYKIVTNWMKKNNKKSPQDFDSCN